MRVHDKNGVHVGSCHACHRTVAATLASSAAVHYMRHYDDGHLRCDASGFVAAWQCTQPV